MRGPTTPTRSSIAITRCPGCTLDVSALPPPASFCPACGRRLRAAPTIASRLLAIAARLRRSPPATAADGGPRSPVVVGYSNALWRLGWRYEHGRGTARNVPEAIRCYRKSAGLGNAEAQSRLEVDPVTPRQVLPIPTTVDHAGESPA